MLNQSYVEVQGVTGANEAVRELWTEYWSSLGLGEDFQNFAEELRSLPGVYAPPGGCLLLAHVKGQLAGTAALRQLNKDAGEMKRLYVRPGFRNQGIALTLLSRLITEAKARGFKHLYCDTLPTMTAAQALYRRHGFHETTAYTAHPTPEATYLHLAL